MTPKERFLRSPDAKAFADISASDTFYEAMHYSQLQIIEQPLRPEIDHRSFFAGVNALKRQLFTIAIPEEPDAPQAKPSLNYDAYNSPARPFLNNPGRSKPTKPTA